MSSSILNVTFDCSDAASTAQFWSAVTGWPWSTRILLLTSIAALVLLLVPPTSAVLARPPHKQQAGTFEAITR